MGRICSRSADTSRPAEALLLVAQNMLIDQTPLLHLIAAAVLKTTGTVIALALVYPFIVTTLAHTLSSGHVPH